MKASRILLVMGLLSMLGLSCKTGGHGNDYVKRDAPTGKLTEFYYVHSGTMAQPFKEYSLKLLDNGEVEFFAHNLGEYHDTLIVTSEVLDTVSNMIIRNEIYRYKDHYTPSVEILDGEGWHYSAHYDDDVSLYSGGTNAWPRNYALPIISNYLDSIAVKAGARNLGFEDW